MKIKIERPLVTFDLETTGVNVAKDRIVQIALTKTFPDGTVDIKNYLINPQMPIPDEASAVHKITDDMVLNEPIFEKYAKNMETYLNGCDLMGYNSNAFDIPLLSEEFSRCGIKWPLGDVKFIDVYKIEKSLNSHKLSETYKRYTGEELDGAHDAMVDVNGTNVIFDAQCDKYNLPESIDDIIALYEKTDDGRERFDIAGKMYKIDGNVYWSFGKNKDNLVSEDIGYCKWFLKSDFPSDSKNKLQDILDNDR